MNNEKMILRVNPQYLIILLTLLIIPLCDSFLTSSRTITTYYGELRGLIVKPNNRALGEVEVFLGVPYVAPPIGRFRFMPPTPLGKWRGTRRADSMPPVCPQKLPDVSNRRESLKRMPVGRYNYLQRLIPQLRNQSEDCLYLNIYTPVRENYLKTSEQLPVLVYIHGESYEWNSGNPYDGTVLASYGQVVVITINFRLGILGFLRPAVSERSVSNLGLLDQIAALHWIRENIAVFGGDPKSVTIFGHGTGAALANLLLISPVTQASKAGLFHRAILMSGSALSKWAFTWDPYKYTTQVAKALKCPLLERNDDLAQCLRSKTVEEMLAVPLDPSPFTTPLGPIMDGTIIKQDELRMVLSIDRGTLSKYDLLYGVTSAESFNILNASEVKYGMSKERRNLLLQAYISNTFHHQTSAIYAAVDNEYTTWNSSSRSTPGKRIEMELRDRVLQVLSDAQIVAPVVSMGDLHSDLNSRSYFYVFNHQSLYGDYPFYQGTVHGEELPYVFGAPLVGGFSHFGLNYTLEEQFLSELVMTLWTNFAKTGNPNLPTPQGYKTEGSPFNWNENMRTLWPPYDRMSQEYLHIDMQVVKKSHYRAKKLALWNRLIPDLISSSTMSVSLLPQKPTTVHLAPTVKHKPIPKPTPKAVFPKCKPMTIPPASYPYTSYPPKPINSQPDKENSIEKLEQGSEAKPSPAPPTYAGTPMSVVILIGITILFLNCFAIAGIYYKRDKIRLGQSRLSREESTDKKEESNEDVEVQLPNLDSPSKPKKDEDDNKKQKSSMPSKSRLDGYDSEELLLGSSRPSASREASLKMTQVQPHTFFPSALFSKEEKKTPTKEQKGGTKASKMSPYSHKRNKSENSIYSEVSMQNSPDIVYRKNPLNKFKNEGSLPPKAMNKSSTSIASIKSTSSVKSNVSRSSVKSNSSAKPIKKNASCQSLPTPEYSWGITREMTMGRDDPESIDEKCTLDRQHAVATMQKRKYPKLLPEVPFVIETHAATLPKVKPPPPLRSTSLTSRDMEELEDIHVIYRKGRNAKSDHSANSCGVANMEPFYGTGAGEAPASPSGMYGASEAPTATVRRSRKSDGFEYGQNGIYTQYPPYESVMQKEPKILSAPHIPEPVKNYSFSDSRSPHSSLGTFGKSKETTKSNYNEVKSILSPVNDSLVTTSTTSSSTDTSPQPFHSSGLAASSVYFTKPRNDTPYSVNKTDEDNDLSMGLFYNHKENTGTVKKKSPSSSKYQQLPEKADKTLVKPLKSALKTTSAYDKPKPCASASSLSSSASINLSPVSSKSMYSIREHEPDHSNSLKKKRR